MGKLNFEHDIEFLKIKIIDGFLNYGHYLISFPKFFRDTFLTAVNNADILKNLNNVFLVSK